MRQTITILTLALVMAVMLFGCAPPPIFPCVVLYQDANYSGATTEFQNISSFNLNNFNDRASSLRIDWSAMSSCDVTKVTLFEHANYEGRSKEYTSDSSSLDDFNDIASSIKIE